MRARIEANWICAECGMMLGRIRLSDGACLFSHKLSDMGVPGAAHSSCPNTGKVFKDPLFELEEVEDPRPT